MSQNYGEMLRKRRTIRKITLVELSEGTGISQTELAKVELDHQILTEDQKQKVEEFIRLRGLLRNLNPA